MRKKLLFFFVVLTFLISGCNSKKETDEKSKLFSLKTVRNEMDDTMEKAYRGEYENLNFAKFQPVITEEKEVTDITEIATQAGTEEKTIEESVSEQYKWLCEIAGETLDKKKVKDFKCNLSLDQVEKKLEEGTYPEKAGLEDGYKLPNLIYIEEDKKGNTKRYFAANSGKCEFVAQFGTVANSEDVDFVKEYYANATDGSLEDTYELEDGECSIKEAIQWAEEYENEGKPFSPGKDIRISASKIRVYKRKNGTYVLNVGMRRSYKGVTFQNAYQGTGVTDTTLDYDMCEIAMINRKCPDNVEGMGGNEIIEEGQSYSEIITLDRAFTILNEQIGKNTDCTVLSAELSYCMHGEEREISEQYGYWDVCHGAVSWKVEVKNKVDDQITIFYIGVTDYDGEEIEQVTFH